MSEREPNYSGKRWTDRSIHVSKHEFRCAFCGRLRKGAWRYVDGGKSCEQCNREYDPLDCKSCEYRKNSIVKIKCPTCKGKGYLTNDKCKSENED